jgi:hypothetical protein
MHGGTARLASMRSQISLPRLVVALVTASLLGVLLWPWGGGEAGQW